MKLKIETTDVIEILKEYFKLKENVETVNDVNVSKEWDKKVKLADVVDAFVNAELQAEMKMENNMDVIERIKYCLNKNDINYKYNSDTNIFSFDNNAQLLDAVEEIDWICGDDYTRDDNKLEIKVEA